MDSRLLVLGGTGMLGSAVVAVAARRHPHVLVTARGPERLRHHDGVTEVSFDAEVDDTAALGLREGDVVINCVGVIRHLLDDSSRSDRRTAISVNASFPYSLAAAAEASGARVIQIATDCVFSGRRGRYSESDAHDADDVYGQTKSLGEVPSPSVLNIRCSIIGPEPSGGVSLQEWVLGHRPHSRLNGFIDHLWNGVTTETFARIAVGLAAAETWWSGLYHLVPDDVVTKAELCELILGAHDRRDVEVVPTVSARAVDRSLATEHPEFNAAAWRLGGWESAPTIAQMIERASIDEGMTR